MLLSELSEAYKLRNLRSATRASLRIWEISLRWFARFLDRPPELQDLNETTVAKFCQWRRLSVSAATINRDLGTLLALWRWGHKIGYCSEWPQIELEKVPRRAPIAWTREEFSVLWNAAKDAPGRVGSIPARLWWPAMLLTMFDSGERIGALLGLTWADVDLRQCWVIFSAETRKGQTEDSVVRIHQDTAIALGKLPRGSGRDPVFPWPYSPTYLWNRYGKLLEAAGLPSDRRRKFHCVRKTVASHLAAAGGNPTEALRHSSTRITQVYLDPRITKPEQPIDRLWRPE